MSIALFNDNQVIKLKMSGGRYRVIATPATCIYNDQPAYLLKSLRPIETPPFFRSQADVETQWEPTED